MAKKNSLKTVPYGTRFRWVPNGENFQGRALLEYVGGWEKDVEWLPNTPFTATLKIDSLERGRSAARFWFEDVETKTQYPFFGQGLTDMLRNVNMVKGMVTGTWIAVKRGSNYGIELYEES